MPIGLLLILYLLTLYLLAILFLSRYIRAQQKEEALGADVRFALKEGQTILGVGDTKGMMYFFIGDDEDIHEFQDK